MLELYLMCHDALLGMDKRQTPFWLRPFYRLV
jgi:hypothetical protein